MYIYIYMKFAQTVHLTQKKYVQTVAYTLTKIQNIAAVAAVTAVGTSEFDEFLAPEADAAVAAVATFDKDFRFVQELHRNSSKPNDNLPTKKGERPAIPLKRANE